jgi:alanyl-tRNA synthetase
LPATEAARAEEIANRVVLENRPLTAKFYESAELAALPLRKAPTKSENIRIVAVQEFDYSPCGGTHCRFSGEVGPIKVRKWERRGAESRVEFLCGWRALRDYGWKHQAITEMANLFSVKDKEVAATVSRLADETRLQRKTLEELQNRALDYEAAELRASATMAQGIAFVTHVFPERDQEEVKRLALRLMEREKTVALLGIGGDKGRLILARSSDIDIDMAQLLREIGRTFGGGGGGQPQLAQGGGMDATRLPAALEWAMARCQEAISHSLAGGTKQ